MGLKLSDREPKSRMKDAFGKANKVAVLDSEVLAVLKGLERPGDSVPFLDDLIDTFISEAPLVLASLESAIKGKDVVLVAKISHHLKGLSGNIGVNRLAALCVVLEEYADGMHNPDSICRVLNRACRDSIEELRKTWKR